MIADPEVNYYVCSSNMRPGTLTKNRTLERAKKNRVLTYQNLT